MSRRQSFDTRDMLRLEVGRRLYGEGDSRRNLIKNPNGERGAWGWITPAALTTLIGGSAENFSNALLILGGDTATASFTAYAEATPAVPGQYFTASYRLRRAISAGRQIRLSIRWLDAAGVQIGGASGVTTVGSAQASMTRVASVAVFAPPNTAYAQLVMENLYVSGSPVNRDVWFDQVMLSRTASGAATPAYQEPYVYQDVLGSVYKIDVDRAGLTLGTLVADIADSALDPSVNNLIRPGNPIRLLASIAEDPTVREPLFTGEIQDGVVQYALTHKVASKRARIKLTAVDPAKTLANVQQEAGVSELSHLSYLMEGAGVPWSSGGDTAQRSGAPTVISRNENASLLDQIASTRDTNRALAWVSRYGVLWFSSVVYLNQDLASEFQDADYLADIDVDYDARRIINEVTVKSLSLDAEGKTVETVFGPYVSEPSIREWGRFAQEFTVQGMTEAQAKAYAGQVLVANSAPQKSVRSLSFRVQELEDFRTAYVNADDYIRRRRVHLDLYDRVLVGNAVASIEHELRITSIKHSITAKRWTVSLSFDKVGGVAMPSPAPPLAPAKGPTYPLYVAANPNVAGGFKLWRDGRVVTINLGVTVTIAWANELAMAVIPLGHRPPEDMYVSAADSASGSLVLLHLTASGEIRRVFGQGANTGTLGVLTYQTTV